MGRNRKELDIITRQILLGYEVIATFYRKSNYFGLQLPRIPFIERVYHGSVSYALRSTKVWINEDLQEVAALVQHYGIPTRLLDWTQDIIVALYFASINVLKKIKPKPINGINVSENMVIWALASDVIQNHNAAKNPEARTQLRLVTPPYSNNQNLYAQKGVLSFWEIENDKEWYQLEPKKYEVPKIDRTPLDELLQQVYENSDITVLYKFELPIMKSLNIFSYLMSMKYTTGKYFPGYAGMEEEGLFRDVADKVAKAGIELDEPFNMPQWARK